MPCPRCGYDLRDRADHAATRCPECGENLSAWDLMLARFSRRVFRHELAFTLLWPAAAVAPSVATLALALAAIDFDKQPLVKTALNAFAVACALGCAVILPWMLNLQRGGFLAMALVVAAALFALNQVMINLLIV